LEQAEKNRPFRSAIGVFLALLFIRLIFLAVSGPIREDDSFYYLANARQMLRMAGLSSGDSPGLESVSVRTPLYPLFLAIVAALSGRGDVDRVYPFVAFLQLVISALSASLLYLWLEKRRPKSGRFFFALSALSLGMATMACSLLTETLYEFLLVLAFLAIDSILENPPGRVFGKALGGGILCGLAALCRPIGQILCVLLIPWFLLSGELKKTWRPLVIALAGFFLAVFPWMMRNYYHWESFQLSPLSGFSLQLIGQKIDPEMVKRPPEFESWDPVRKDAWDTSRMKLVIRKYPGRYATHVFRHVGRFILSTETTRIGWKRITGREFLPFPIKEGLTVAAFFLYGILPLFGVFFIILKRREREVFIPLVLILGIYYTHLAGTVLIIPPYDRYRIPLQPLLWTAACIMIFFGKKD